MNFIYDLSCQLRQQHCEILFIDTDPICFAHPTIFIFPFQISDDFGHFKHVLCPDATINAYYSLGVRSYVVIYTQNGVTKYLTKLKGMSLNSNNTNKYLTPTVFQEFIDKRFRGEVEKMFIPQSRKKIDKQTKTFKHIISAFEFSNEVHVKHFILEKDSTYKTYSYGYDFANLNKQ